VTKIMVFGAGGQIGRHLIETGAQLGRNVVALTHAEADICDPSAVESTIARHRPTAIVNAAAYTAVDNAENEPKRAFEVNRDGATIVAAAAAKAELPLIHLSTDYVFDGTAREPYREEDAVNPQGVYARSKEAGERGVREVHDRYLILRTAWVYGPFGTNFLRTMLRLGTERNELGVVDDQTGSPTATPDIAATVLTMLEQAEASDFRLGHLPCRRRHRDLVQLRRHDLRRGSEVRPERSPAPADRHQRLSDGRATPGLFGAQHGETSSPVRH